MDGMQNQASELMNAHIRRQAGRGRQPQEDQPEEPAPQRVDLGAGPRAPVERADPNGRMNRWMRNRRHQLATRTEHVVIPSQRRTP